MKTLISATELQAQLAGPTPPVLLDCSFELTDTEAGRRAWATAHLPGAQYVHLDEDLSGPKHDANGVFRGRHPLPSRDALSATLARLGIGLSSPVVVYDAQGAAFAARAWWLLRWMGHEDVAVLDGGRAAWQAAGGALDSAPTPARPTSAPYPTRAPGWPTMEAEALLQQLGRLRLIDARAPERFRGDVEPLDRAAGHIPGALNRPFKANLADDGRFKTRAALHAEWAPLLAGNEMVVHYCGSGATACHNLLAVAHAGLGEGVLYPGSWSEWSSQASRPQARG